MAYTEPVVQGCFMQASRQYLSPEELYVLIAYHAMQHVVAMREVMIQDLTLRQPLITVLPTAKKS